MKEENPNTPKSYKNFLNVIISKWHETQCSKYNTNENFIIYNFGYIWKTQILKDTESNLVDIDEALSDVYNNNNFDIFLAAINEIEQEYIETNKCVGDDFYIPENMFNNIPKEITFIEQPPDNPDNPDNAVDDDNYFLENNDSREKQTTVGGGYNSNKNKTKKIKQNKKKHKKTHKK